MCILCGQRDLSNLPCPKLGFVILKALFGCVVVVSGRNCQGLSFQHRPLPCSQRDKAQRGQYASWHVGSERLVTHLDKQVGKSLIQAFIIHPSIHPSIPPSLHPSIPHPSVRACVRACMHACMHHSFIHACFYSIGHSIKQQ